MSAQSDLYESIAHSDKKRVKELVTHDHDIDVNEPFTQFTKHPSNTEVTDLLSEGMTPLALAAQKSDVEMLEIIKMLIKGGEDGLYLRLFSSLSLHVIY